MNMGEKRKELYSAVLITILFPISALRSERDQTDNGGRKRESLKTNKMGTQTSSLP